MAAMASVEDAARILGIGRNQAYAAVERGTIPALRMGRRWLIAHATLERILAGEIVSR
jgi:excisionase family DNA binding protein